MKESRNLRPFSNIKTISKISSWGKNRIFNISLRKEFNMMTRARTGHGTEFLKRNGSHKIGWGHILSLISMLFSLFRSCLYFISLYSSIFGLFFTLMQFFALTNEHVHQFSFFLMILSPHYHHTEEYECFSSRDSSISSFEAAFNFHCCQYTCYSFLISCNMKKKCFQDKMGDKTRKPNFTPNTMSSEGGFISFLWIKQ